MALKRAGISDIADQRVDKLSGGQTQRVRFALAIAGDVELIVLDEPTTALAEGDSPLTQRERDALRASRDGATVAEIASALYQSEGTVRNYLSACIQKTSGRNRADALRIANERGWL
jgi:DNA-binding NarL/FixJ family response regulator